MANYLPFFPITYCLKFAYYNSPALLKFVFSQIILLQIHQNFLYYNIFLIIRHSQVLLISSYSFLLVYTYHLVMFHLYSMALSTFLLIFQTIAFLWQHCNIILYHRFDIYLVW